MDGGDLYRKLLATASHTQQQRHAALHHGSGQHLAGNVFLPAIQQRTSAQSALSMKHLEVIEQCILAENRREEQLAKCPSEKERRYLTKKFIAQREHERDLLQALMLGRPTDQELQIVDVETAAHKLSQASSSPDGRRSKDDGQGVRILSTSPDKVIPMHGDKTFTTTTPSNKKPTKAVSPHFHGIKSPARRREEQAKESMFPEWNTSPSKAPRSQSPTRDRPTRSASYSSKVPPQSPSRKVTAESPLSQSLAKSPLRQPVRMSQRDPKPPIPSPSPTKRKMRVSAVTQNSSATNAGTKASQDGHDGGPAVSFSGATSFQEARQQAMAMLHETLGHVDDGTQTTDRTYGLIGSNDERLGCRDQKFVQMLAHEGTTSPTKMASGYGRPHSSPEPRKRRPSAEALVLPALSHAPSDVVLPRIEFFHSSKDDRDSDPQSRAVTYTLDDRAKKIHVLTSDTVPSAVADEVVQRSEPPVAAEEEMWAEVRSDCGAAVAQSQDGEDSLELDTLDSLTKEGESLDDWEQLERLAREEDAAAQATEADDAGVAVHPDDTDEATGDVSDQEILVEEHDTTGNSETVAPPTSEEDEDESHVVLDILYSIIHQLEDESMDAEPLVEIAVERTITIERKTEIRSSPLVNYGRLATCIQSAFRGLRARRAFRLALYQQALASGVLGAMPGTTQGHSGWYQDPKSFMAYYFVVRADGEWVQRAVLRCSTLVLTHYAMREQILSRVQIPRDDEELDD